MTTWAEQWVTSKGYQDAMAAKAKGDSEFWTRHHKVMAELDKQDRITDVILNSAGYGLVWVMVSILALAVGAVIF